MKRAIVSGYAGLEYSRLAEATWPAMQKYADAVGAAFLRVTLDSGRRPSSWGKLPAIAKALARHDEVLWLDADVSVAGACRDIFEDFQPGFEAGACWLTDERGNGHYNAGVLLARRDFLETLVLAAMQDDCVYHHWWEQAAINRLVSEKTMQKIGEEWNSWRGTSSSVVPQFRHACGAGTVDERIAWLAGVEEVNRKCRA